MHVMLKRGILFFRKGDISSALTSFEEYLALCRQEGVQEDETTSTALLKREDLDSTQSTVDEDLNVEAGEPSSSEPSSTIEVPASPRASNRPEDHTSSSPAAGPLTASNRSEDRGRAAQVTPTTTRSVSFDSPKAASRPTMKGFFSFALIFILQSMPRNQSQSNQRPRSLPMARSRPCSIYRSR